MIGRACLWLFTQRQIPLIQLRLLRHQIALMRGCIQQPNEKRSTGYEGPLHSAGSAQGCHRSGLCEQRGVQERRLGKLQRPHNCSGIWEAAAAITAMEEYGNVQQSLHISEPQQQIRQTAGFFFKKKALGGGEEMEHAFPFRTIFKARIWEGILLLFPSPKWVFKKSYCTDCQCQCVKILPDKHRNMGFRIHSKASRFQCRNRKSRGIGILNRLWIQWFLCWSGGVVMTGTNSQCKRG